jgi:hypothetical protein
MIYLLSKSTYSFDTARVNLAADYTVLSIISNYQEQQSGYGQDSPETYDACPDESVEMVFSTCETSIPTAMAGVNKAVEIAESQGYKVERLLGSQENTTAIKNWLACDNLIMFGRIGHGSETGIMLDDGMLNYTYFQNLSSTALNDKVLYFNSCEVHNDPLEPAIFDAGVQKFIGGDVLLEMGTSEEVFKCFMDDVIVDNAAMTTTLSSCESAHYPQTGAHGISGNGSDYLNGNPVPDPEPDPEPSGQCVTADNISHISEDRAYECGMFNMEACAVGSVDPLGWAVSWQTSSVQETSDGYWEKVESCE